MSDHRIRLATVADLEAIHAIYAHYVVHSTCTFQLEPEPIESRRQEFANRRPEHPLTVVESAGDVLGWASLSPWKSRAGYRHAVEFSVYLHPNQCGRGLGRALLDDLLERARALGHHVVIGGTCTEHEASMRLQRSAGFTQVALFREVGYKFGRWLDVAYFERILAEADPSAPGPG